MQCWKRVDALAGSSADLPMEDWAVRASLLLYNLHINAAVLFVKYPDNTSPFETQPHTGPGDALAAAQLSEEEGEAAGDGFENEP